MNFSERTVTILKNFSTINPSILFKEGNQLRTISPQKTVMAIANIEDNIPSQACIYDMSRFLSIYSLYNKPNVDFGDKYFTISEGKKKTKYVYADVAMIIHPYDKDLNPKEIKLPSSDVSVDVEWSDLQSVIKASGVLQLPEISFVGENGGIFLKAIDSGNPSADTYGVELGETSDDFSLIIKTENLKLLPQNYKVTLSSKGISLFESDDIKYFIAIESKSTYRKG